LVQEDLKCR